jgi:4-amino-4-deoxychorismate lyase
MIFVNGEENENIKASDRGFQYGDGLFETIEVQDGKPLFLGQHLSRLIKSCKRLKIPEPDADELTRNVIRVCKNTAHAVLKIIITRGMGQRGYFQPNPIIPTQVISINPYPEFASEFSSLGVNLRFCETRLSLNPSLAGMKHLNRLEQILARAEWDDAAIHEGIMLDMQDRVIEGTMTNLFYVKNNIVYTAKLSYSGVAGIMREIIMELLAENNQPAIEHDFDKTNLLSADEVFICNSIIGIWPVNTIENVFYSSQRPITERLMTGLKGLKEKELQHD